MILLMYTMKRRPSNETKETTGKYGFSFWFCGTLVCATKSQAKILTIKHSTKTFIQPNTKEKQLLI